MLTRIWDDLLSPLDMQVMMDAGYTSRGAVGWNSRGIGHRPALVIVDMENQGVGPDAPILDAVKVFPTAVGEDGWRAAREIRRLLEVARATAIPVVHTHAFLLPGQDESAIEFIEPLNPCDGEIVIQKECASAFFGTHLLRYLVQRHVDTIILTGTSTSGCIRATAVDAQQNGFYVTVPEECVFDRIGVSHKVGLLDLWMKYANVVSTNEVLAYLDGFTNCQEAIPAGSNT